MPHQMIIESITPKAAEQLLSTMVKNRELSQLKVVEYAIAMDEGRWSLNGETIKIDKQGRLFDGQNRLNACILANKPFRTYVARGIEDANAFSTVDVGKNRTGGDIFGIAGFANQNVAAGAAMVIYAFKHCTLGWTGPTSRRSNLRKSRVGAMLDAAPQGGAVSKQELLEWAGTVKDELLSAVRFAGSSKSRRLLGTSTIAGLFYLFREKDALAAHEFFDALGEGAGLAATDPILHLREKLLEHKRKVGLKMSRWYYVGITVKTWNKRRSGAQVRSLYVAENEAFPGKIE
jgi:hypothetical protein